MSSIIPSGKTRVMVAQTIANPLSEGYSGGEALYSPENREVVETTPIPNQPEMEKPVKKTPLKRDESNGSTLTDYIFEKLESFGYPGRRLEEFKRKFVKETISPDGTKDIKIEIPDRYYPDEQGNIKTIETEDLGSIINEINHKFGLNFNGAERSEGKWLINLTSAKRESPEEQPIERDNLDEVYGPSGDTSGKKKKVKAESIYELIKASKTDELINELSKKDGVKNAS